MNADWLNTHETIDNDARCHMLTPTDVIVIWAIGLDMYLRAHGLKEVSN